MQGRSAALVKGVLCSAISSCWMKLLMTSSFIICEGKLEIKWYEPDWILKMIVHFIEWADDLTLWEKVRARISGRDLTLADQHNCPWNPLLSWRLLVRLQTGKRLPACVNAANHSKLELAINTGLKTWRKVEGRKGCCSTLLIRWSVSDKRCTDDCRCELIGATNHVAKHAGDDS